MRPVTVVALVTRLLACAIAGCEPSSSATTAQTGGTSGFEGQPQAGSPGTVGGNGGDSGGVGGLSGTGVAGMVDGTAAVGGAGAGSAGQFGIAGGGAMNGSGSGGAGGMAGVGGIGGAGGGGGTVADAGSDSVFHVFLLLGQSNMAGYPKAQDADKFEDSRIRVLGFDDCPSTGRKKDQWDVAAPPLHECWNGAIGPGDHFAKTLIERLPAGDTIGLVPCAISGERIETFLKSGGTKYAWIVERARLAQEAGGVIEGLLFHQGESNNGDPSWPGKVNALVTDLRVDLALGEAPFVAGELPYDSPLMGHNTLVNMLTTVISNAHLVSASGLALDSADMTRLHFGHDAQETFGRRYAETMIEALDW
jgi:hypothetical protein